MKKIIIISFIAIGTLFIFGAFFDNEDSIEGGIDCEATYPCTGYEIANIERYDSIRVELYDAAFDIITKTKKYYDECPDSEKQYCIYSDISGKNRRIIEHYRVPDLKILIDAIQEMDDASCLADAFDEELIKYDRLYEEYKKYHGGAEL